MCLLSVVLLTGCKSESLLSVHPANAYSGGPAKAPTHLKTIVSLAAQPNALSRIKVDTARIHPLDHLIEAGAQLQANANAVTRVSPPISGKVTAVNACVGDSVKKGQVIATITSQEIGSLVTDLFKAETDIDSQLASDKMQIDFEMKQTASELALCRKQFERAKLLLDEKIGSQASLESAQTEYEKHSYVIEALQQKKLKAEAIANDKKRLARASLEQKLMVLGMPSSTIAKILRDRSVVNMIPIQTPQTGIVLERNVNIGELVDPSKSLFVVDDIDNLWLVADIFEQDVQNVKAGQNIEFNVDCFPNKTFTGKLDFVAGTINPDTRTLAVRAVVGNPGLKLKPKMFARMKIFGEKRPVLAVPATAVQDAGSEKVVYIPLSNGEFEERRITAGEEAGGYLEILKGLKNGEKVVVSGSFTLRSQALKQGRY
jgi:cobalt-zinc-cadmium efflux system membrane fusion protein